MLQNYKALWRQQVKFGLSLGKGMFTLMKNLGWEFTTESRLMSSSHLAFSFLLAERKRKHPTMQKLA